MTEQGKKIIAVAIGIAVLLAVYPPWHIPFDSGVSVSRGYAFIWNPPANASINILTLFVQWVGVLLLGFLGVMLFGRPQK